MAVVISPIQDALSAYLAGRSYSNTIVIVDQNTRRDCYPRVKPFLPEHRLIEVLAGEENKHLGTCEQIWDEMTDAQLDRHALVLNLGGGVIGDMGGFCAATYKRGIDFVQLPTTLLAQVDASVGGKLGIDFRGFKNHIGVFTLPQSVLIDADFLQTLPYRELRSGFAEVIKHCLIRDADMFWRLFDVPLEEQNFPVLIAHSVAIKESIVAEDPNEKGVRKILNFGHTLGHAIETFYLNKNRLLHGEAIAIGMITESHLSVQKGMLDAASLQQITERIISLYGKVPLEVSDYEAIIHHTVQDKKNRGGDVRFSLLEGIGNCLYDIVCTPDQMRAALDFYRTKA